MFQTITKELRHHAPFTVLGTLMGIGLMFLCWNIPKELSYRLFYIFHPLHVFFSALVTSSMYHLHQLSAGRKCDFWKLILIGYVGSVGIGTLSDSLIPYFGELMLGLPHAHAHIGFIEEWWIVNPLAILGVLLAHWRPFTKFPHAMHLLLSVWASLFHILMAVGPDANWSFYIIIAAFLFISVWVPCCTSDIVFPLLFIKDPAQRPSCPHCKH